MLQGDIGEIGLDGINGEDVSVFYIYFFSFSHELLTHKIFL